MGREAQRRCGEGWAPCPAQSQSHRAGHWPLGGVSGWHTCQPVSSQAGPAGSKTPLCIPAPPLGRLGPDAGLSLSIYKMGRASLVAQWLRICLLMQGTRVRALVWEDPTCRGATRPVSHNY